MTNEEFQNLVLKKLQSLDEGQKTLTEGQKELYSLFQALENRTEENSAKLTSLEEKMPYLEGKVTNTQKAVDSVKTELTEFRDETMQNFNSIDISIEYLANKLVKHDM